MSQLNQTQDYEVVVLGGGSAGYAAARAAANLGRRTAVVDGADPLGGLCILRGCMPTKAMLYSAEIKRLAEKAGVWGIRTGTVAGDASSILARKNSMIREFASYRMEQLTSGPFTLIRSHAVFVSPKSVQLTDGTRIQADRFVLATGSSVDLPDIPGLKETGFLISDDCLNLKAYPKSMIVLGGGAVAMELAQFFSRMDVKVTVIQRSPQILKGFDEDAASTVQSALVEEGMTLYTGTRLIGVAKHGNTKEVKFEYEGSVHRVQGEEILCALGRHPNTRHLKLPAARVETDPKGRILCDAFMRTSNPDVFAAGDCTSDLEVVHLAVIQGETAGMNAANPSPKVRVDRRLDMSVVFTDPQAALVGSTERELLKQGIEYAKASYPFNDHGKSLIMDCRHGFVKLLADGRTGEILGGSCVGPNAGDLIHEITVAMAGKMNVKTFASIPHYHPTLAEIWTYPAEMLASKD